MEPTFNDYVALIYNRFEAFVPGSASASKLGHPYVYQQQSMMTYFRWMQFKRISAFKTQWRWLIQHPEALPVLGWEIVPDRTTLSRRYKALSSLREDFVQFLGESSGALGQALTTDHLYEDKRLFKAQGPVWHQNQRKVGGIPEKLRHLDTDASWSKSAYHGWVYGYGLHLTCNQAGFPGLMLTETATFSEKAAVKRKDPIMLDRLQPKTFCGDDAYTLALRIRAWARQGIIVLTPALRWRTGRYAQAYRRFIQRPIMAAWLRRRKTAIEPVFDLLGKLLGVTGKQKQLAIQPLAPVGTTIGLAVVSLQIAMIANSIWNLPFRSISTIKGAFA